MLPSGQLAPARAPEQRGRALGRLPNSWRGSVRLRGIGALAAGLSALLAVTCLATAPANATCTPDPASSGQTVTCDNDADGFQAGGGVDHLTVNVLPAATVSDGGSGVAIGVNDFSTVTNSGTITAGSFGTGIFAGANSTIINTATGTIAVGDDSVGISVFGNSTVTNAGAITTGPSGGPAGGIFAFGHDNTLVNAATGTINVGDNAVGFFVQGDRATISNGGVVAVGTGGAGIAYDGSYSTITNSNRIVGGDASSGIFITGDSNSITNTGTIITGSGNS